MLFISVVANPNDFYFIYYGIFLTLFQLVNFLIFWLPAADLPPFLCPILSLGSLPQTDKLCLFVGVTIPLVLHKKLNRDGLSGCQLVQMKQFIQFENRTQLWFVVKLE